MFRSVAVLVLSLAVLQSICFAQANPEKPEQVGVCDLVREPERFNGKMISARGRASIALEHFGLSAASCGSEWTDDIWLEYGRGPKRQPTTWCCGDMIPRDRLVLVQDGDFRNFHRLLTAERRAKGCYAGQCYVYDVTATITGRLDAVAAETGRNGTRL